MKPSEFNYDEYNRKCEMINQRSGDFQRNNFLPVVQWTLGKGVFEGKCRYRDTSLEIQLEGIRDTMETDNDWIPYLEPWHGVGVFAQAFGCQFEWSEIDAPWTRFIASDIDQLRRIEKPELNKSEMLQYVLDTTEYFDKKTRGEIAIAATDTQSPLSTMSLICDPCWMLTEAWEYPEDFHRVLGYITDLIIEFTLEQRKLCSKTATPGHTMWSPDFLSGISLSDDLLAMIGPDFYAEFGKPYNEKIADALGGVVIHSCGKWAHNFEVAKSIRNITMVDLAISKSFDPDPNIPDKIIEGFGGKDCPVQVRCDPKDMEAIERIISSDVRAILSLSWNENPLERQSAYETIKKKWDKYKSGGTCK